MGNMKTKRNARKARKARKVQNMRKTRNARKALNKLNKTMKNARKVGGGYSRETQLKIDELQEELDNMAPQFQKLQEKRIREMENWWKKNATPTLYKLNEQLRENNRLLYRTEQPARRQKALRANETKLRQEIEEFKIHKQIESDIMFDIRTKYKKLNQLKIRRIDARNEINKLVKKSQNKKSIRKDSRKAAASASTSVTRKRSNSRSRSNSSGSRKVAARARPFVSKSKRQ